MYIHKQLIVVITILVLLLFGIVACSTKAQPTPAAPSPSNTAPAISPTPIPAPVTPEKPAATPVQPTVSPETLIYKSQVIYRSSDDLNGFVCGNSIGEAADFRLDTDVSFVKGAGFCSYLIIFRAQDVNNCYYFEVVLVNNQFALGKRVNGSWVYLNSGISPLLVRGDTNHIRIICRESILQVYANNVKLAEATDSTYTSGKTYLAARASGSPRTQIEFDNVSLSSIGK